jgi:hypothetical protein
MMQVMPMNDLEPPRRNRFAQRSLAGWRGVCGSRRGAADQFDIQVPKVNDLHTGECGSGAFTCEDRDGTTKFRQRAGQVRNV